MVVCGCAAAKTVGAFVFGKIFDDTALVNPDDFNIEAALGGGAPVTMLVKAGVTAFVIIPNGLFGLTLLVFNKSFR